jgi:penicillin-binding protein 1A
MEMAEAFTTIANLGKSCTLRPFYQVFDANRNLVQDSPLTQEEKFPAAPVFQTVNIMKGVLTHGTGKSTQWSGIPFSNFAGKSGTTNDEKDAWFIGLSPDLLVLVWVGYDEKDRVGLTGSAAALPAWISFMKGAGAYRTEADFVAPTGLMACELPRPELPATPGGAPENFIEYFQPGTEPPGINCQPTSGN